MKGCHVATQCSCEPGVIADNLAATLHKFGRDAEAKVWEEQAKRIGVKQRQWRNGWKNR